MGQKYAAQPPHVRYDGPQISAVVIVSIRIELALLPRSFVHPILSSDK